MWTSKSLGALVLIIFGTQAQVACGQDGTNSTVAGAVLERSATTPWESEIGEGYVSSAKDLSLEVGPFTGIRVLGGTQWHDMVLTSLSYGHVLDNTVGRGTWHQGNWELRGELFGGVQHSPASDWIIGLTPHLRYDFATGTRWVPFVDAGAGVTATSIGGPDLSNTFEFNLQATAGTHYFLRNNLALTFETRFVHISCAGISSPNHGVNGVWATIGVAVLF